MATAVEVSFTSKQLHNFCLTVVRYYDKRNAQGKVDERIVNINPVTTELTHLH